MVASGLLGIGVTLPIGGADMPVVISLLNSYSGVAAAAAGFVVGSQLLIVAGAMVGAAGLILTQVMCNGMNRSLVSVLFGGALVRPVLPPVAAVVNTPTSPAAAWRSVRSPSRRLNGW